MSSFFVSSKCDFFFLLLLHVQPNIGHFLLIVLFCPCMYFFCSKILEYISDLIIILYIAMYLYFRGFLTLKSSLFLSLYLTPSLSLLPPFSFPPSLPLILLILFIVLPLIFLTYFYYLLFFSILSLSVSPYRYLSFSLSYF